MPDTSEPRAMLPFPTGPDLSAEAAPQDPLQGDWAEGLRGPVREVPIKRPQRLRGQSGPTPRPLAAAAPAPEQKTEQADLRILAAMAGALQSPAAADAEVEAPDAWASTDDQLASVPPPARSTAGAEVLAVAASAAAPGEVPRVEPAADAVGSHGTDETLRPQTAAQLARAAEAAPAAAAPEAAPEPAAAEEVLLLSDAELAEDEPATTAAQPIPDAAAAPAAEVSAVAAPSTGAAPLEGAVPAAAEQAPTQAAPAFELAAAASPAPAVAEPLVLPAALEAQPALPLPAPEEVLALPPADEHAEAAQPEVQLAGAGTPVAAASPLGEMGTDTDAPPLGFRLPPGVEGGDAPAPQAPAAEPLAAAAQSAQGDLATDLASDLDAALAPVASAVTGESQPVPVAALEDPIPAEGVRAQFVAPTVPVNSGWAAPEAPAQTTGETAVNLRPLLHEAGPDATVHEGAPIVVTAEHPAVVPAPLPLPLPLDDDLESTVLSLALEAMQRTAAEAQSPVEAPAPEASAASLVVADVADGEEEFEQLPEDAIAGAADPSASWNHAEIEVNTVHDAPVGNAPWDQAASPSWQAGAPSGEWAGAQQAAPEAPWAASGPPASEGWPGAAAKAAPAESWGEAAPTAPAPETGWDTAPAAPAADTWGTPASPAAESMPWGAPAPATVHSEWAAAPAGPFSADKLVSSPGAADWLIEAAPPPVVSAWAAPPGPAANTWDAPVAAATEAWDAKTQAGFPVEVPARAGSPFAPLPPGALLSPDDSSPGLAAVETPLEDADLLVPIYEPEPVAPSSHLAVTGEHRVAVHTRAGRTRRGLVRDVDLGGTGFSLQPQSAAGAPESVQAAEVKAVFFMLQPGEKPTPGTGGKVRVTFEDGRTIEGLRDGPDAPEGFFLVPSDAARTNTRRIFVARGAVQELREG